MYELVVVNIEAADEVLVGDTGACLETEGECLLETVVGNVGDLGLSISEGNEANASSKKLHLQLYVLSKLNCAIIRDT